MNKKGFFDFEDLIPDMDISPAYILLPLIGAFIGFFTASGGFSYMISGTKFNPGWFTKIFSAVGGAIIGYAIAWWKSD